jgi:hypothetical protein
MNQVIERVHRMRLADGRSTISYHSKANRPLCKGEARPFEGLSPETFVILIAR